MITLPHARWETIQGEADSFAESIKAVVESTLVRLTPEERSIYCQHLAQLGDYWGFEQQANEHDAGHGEGCGCESCRSIYGIAY